MSKNLLNNTIQEVIIHYIQNLDGETPSHLHPFIMQQVESVLIDTVLNYSEGNQSKCARMLGISRSTLSRKLEQYHQIPKSPS